MRPMGERERLVLSALYELGRGKSPEQAEAALLRRFGFLTSDRAATVVDRAITARADAVEMRQSAEGVALQDILPPGRSVNLDVNVSAQVVISSPGSQPEVRTVRIQAGALDTVGEVMSRIMGVVDEWKSLYDSDGRSSEVTIEFIF